MVRLHRQVERLVAFDGACHSVGHVVAQAVERRRGGRLQPLGELPELGGLGAAVLALAPPLRLFRVLREHHAPVEHAAQPARASIRAACRLPRLADLVVPQLALGILGHERVGDDEADALVRQLGVLVKELLVLVGALEQLDTAPLLSKLLVFARDEQRAELRQLEALPRPDAFTLVLLGEELDQHVQLLDVRAQEQLERRVSRVGIASRCDRGIDGCQSFVVFEHQHPLELLIPARHVNQPLTNRLCLAVLVISAGLI